MISIPRLPLPYQPGGEPGKGHVNYLDSADAMLETEFSPPDRYFAVSALLGRLREPMQLPFPPNSLRAADFTLLTKSKKNEHELEERKIRLALEKQQSLILLDKSDTYHMDRPDTRHYWLCTRKFRHIALRRYSANRSTLWKVSS